MLLSVYSIHFSRRERSKVPYIVRQCLEEIERRGMEEVGIYRVSGVATDIQALKTAFDTSQHSLLLFPVTHNHPQCLLGALVSSVTQDDCHVCYFLILPIAAIREMRVQCQSRGSVDSCKSCSVVHEAKNNRGLSAIFYSLIGQHLVGPAKNCSRTHYD